MNLTISLFEKFFSHLDADAMLITDMINVRYLSGFTGSTAQLLLTPEKSFFFSDFRYMTQAGEQVHGFEIREITRRSLVSLCEAIKQTGTQRLGFESTAISFALYDALRENLAGVQLIPIGSDPAVIRAKKRSDEIETIRQAIQIQEKGYHATLPKIRPGIIEKKLARELESAMVTEGADKLSFDTIIASGVRGALPHGIASDKAIQKGELVTIDFGIQYQGYCTDQTCTVVVGEVLPLQREVYQIVQDAHDKAIEIFKPGMTGQQVDSVAREYIEQKGYGKYFGHGLGHGVGLAVHERPVVSQGSKDLLEEGMIFTIEPGIYIPGWGGVRIEDMVLATSHGAEVLTQIPKDLLIL